MEIKLRPREAISQDFLTNLYRKRMSIWDNLPADEDANSKFINKLPAEKPVTLKFTAMNKREQDAKTPEDYKTPDGMQYVFFFEDENGKEKEISQNSVKGKFFKAMQALRVEPGEMVTLSHKGENTGIEWFIRRADVDGGEPGTPGLPGVAGTQTPSEPINPLL